MNPKAEYQCRMTMDYLKQMASAGLLTDAELNMAITLAKARYHICETVHFALDISE